MSITLQTVEIKFRESTGEYLVRPIWNGVDYSVRAYNVGKDESLALRLAEAFTVGKAYEPPASYSHPNGYTACQFIERFRLRTLEQDLDRMGV